MFSDESWKINHFEILSTIDYDHDYTKTNFFFHEKNFFSNITFEEIYSEN